jgi:hypothetical protein
LVGGGWAVVSEQRATKGVIYIVARFLLIYFSLLNVYLENHPLRSFLLAANRGEMTPVV